MEDMINQLTDLLNGEDCFPQAFISELDVPDIPPGKIPVSFNPGNSIFEVKSVTFDQGIWKMQIDNQLPFPISVVFSITNEANSGNNIFNTDQSLQDIDAYSSKEHQEEITTTNTKTINIKSTSYFPRWWKYWLFQ